MLDYKNIVAEQLRMYQLQTHALENMQKRLAVLSEEIGRIGTEPTGEKPRKRDEVKTALTLEYGLLKRRTALLEEEMRFLRDGLDAIDEKARETLRLFYIDRPEGYLDLICTLNGSTSHAGAYYFKDRALQDLVTACYGRL